jgi:SSS family solute:Na+ symporter
MITGLIAFYMISTRLGGLAEASRAVAESDWASSRLAREGLIGKLQFFSYFFIPLSVGMFPHLFQHWLTAKSARSFRLTVVAHPIFIMIVWVPCIMIGVWGAGMFGEGVNPNAVLGRMVSQLVHSPILTGLVGAGVLAAIMSSLDSQFMCLGTMFTNDVIVRLFGHGRFTDGQKIMLARGFIVGIVAVAYGLSVMLVNTAGVFDLGVWCFTGFASLFPLVVASLYWKRVTKAGAFASLLTTAAVWGYLFYQDIFAGHEAGAAEGEMLIGGMMPVAVITLAAVAALVGVSLVTRPPGEDTLRKFFIPRPATGR